MKNLGLIIAIFLIASCSQEETKKIESLRPVKYQAASLMGGSLGRTFSGSAKAGVQTEMSFKVAGTIEKINVKVGQRVRKGYLIAVLDPSDYLLDYEEADASVKNADAQEKKAKSNYERVSILYENQNASLAEYEAAKAEFESAKANEKALKQKRKLAQLQLDYTRLYAPVSGIVNYVYAEENENVARGGSIVTLSSGDNIEVTAGIPEQYIANIEIDQKASVRFPSLPDQEFTGVISEVSYALSDETAVYPVTVELESPSSSIRPGMAADVNIGFEGQTTEPSLIVNASAVGEDQNGNFVFVLEQEQGEEYVARKRPVEVGQLTSEGFEINSGLKEQELVAVAGLQTLLDGMKVSLF